MRKKEAPQESRRHLLAWLWRVPVLALLLGGGTAFWRAYQVHFLKVPPDPEPVFDRVPPLALARLSELGVWEAHEFELLGMPCVLIRLPEPALGGLSAAGGHFIAFSRVCTHLGCTVVYRQDTEAVALAFNYRSEEPSLACPCHLGVFSPAQAGRVVSGPPVLPLVRVELRLEEERLYAVGLERREA